MVLVFVLCGYELDVVDLALGGYYYVDREMVKSNLSFVNGG